MASIKPHGAGYRVQLSVKGQRDSQTFDTKREAVAWAQQREIALRAETAGKLGAVKTLGDALGKYGEEVATTHKGWRWEMIRLKAFERTLPVKMKLSSVTDDHLAAWRDQRLQTVSAGSVLREFKLLSAVLETARRDWKWIDANPAKDVRKPSAPAHRTRTITRREIKAMLRALDYRSSPRSVTQAVALCFLVALRTGMRASELTGLTWANVKPKYATLPDTKNGTVRNVPLSAKAAKTIERVRGFDPDLVFGIKSQTLDALFRRARDRAGLSGFTFHDSRHTAATWIGRSGKLSLMEMCVMFGWKDPKHALIYFNPNASDLADRL